MAPGESHPCWASAPTLFLQLVPPPGVGWALQTLRARPAVATTGQPWKKLPCPPSSCLSLLLTHAHSFQSIHSLCKKPLYPCCSGRDHDHPHVIAYSRAQRGALPQSRSQKQRHQLDSKSSGPSLLYSRLLQEPGVPERRAQCPPQPLPHPAQENSGAYEGRPRPPVCLPQRVSWWAPRTHKSHPPHKGELCLVFYRGTLHPLPPEAPSALSQRQESQTLWACHARPVLVPHGSHSAHVLTEYLKCG